MSTRLYCCIHAWRWEFNYINRPRRYDVTFVPVKVHVRSRRAFILIKESVVLYFSAFLPVVSPLSFEFFWRDRKRVRREGTRKRKGTKEIEKKRIEKEGKKEKDKNDVLFRWSYASPCSELNKSGDDERELLFNSLKLYAWRFRYLSRQPLLSAMTSCTLSLPQRLDYYTFISAPRFLFPFSIPLLRLYLISLPSCFCFTLNLAFSFVSSFSSLSIFYPPSLSFLRSPLYHLSLLFSSPTLQFLFALSRCFFFDAGRAASSFIGSQDSRMQLGPPASRIVDSSVTFEPSRLFSS